MQDRISVYPGRVKLIPVSGQENVYDMTRQDNPTTEGTPLNKSTLLTDEVAEALGLEPTTATPSEAIGKVATNATPQKITITLASANWTGTASPYSQQITIPNGAAGTQVDLQADDAVISAMIGNGISSLYVTNNNGVFTAYATGSKPTIELSVQGTAYNVKESAE